jgi:HK97 family phage major capsid protein
MRTRREITTRAQEIRDRITEIKSKHRPSRDDQIELAGMTDELQELQTEKNELDRAAMVEAAMGRGTGGLRFEGERHGINPFGEGEERPRSGHRDAAMRVIDGLVSANRLPSRAAETVEQITKTGSGLEQSWSQRMVAALGDDAYFRAFTKVLADSERGHLLWERDEQQAFQSVQGLRAEMRSMNSTDDQGGLLSPVVIDPTIQISSAGHINPLRQISRNVQTISDSWRGIRADSVVAHWLPEEQEVTDDSPTLAEEIISVYKSAAFIPASYEIIQDGTNFVSEISKLLLDGLDDLIAGAITTGSGTGEPTGLLTALAGTSSVVPTAMADTLTSADVYTLLNALPPRFRAGAQFAANLAIISALAQMETGNGALRFPGLQNSPPVLLSRSISEISNMDGTLGGGAGNDPILVFGDFQQFVIVNRWPATLEVIPNLFGAARRFPTGQRGFFLHARIGSDVLVNNAFRVLTA